MENVFFRPWIGKNYKQGYKGKKLLILGESHYCDGIQDENCPCGKVKKCLQLSECNDFTSVVLNRFFDYKKGIGEGERWMTTYTRFTNILLGEQVSNAELMEFWDNIVFYTLRPDWNGKKIESFNILGVLPRQLYVLIY